MAHTMRVYYGGIRARHVLNQPMYGIHPWSCVHITASEATPYGSHSYPPWITGPWGQKYHLFVGAAPIWVTNVAPYEGGVTFMLHVDWGSVLNVAVTIRVEDETPVFHRAW